MRIATWNVNSLKVRLPHVLEWLASADCDVLCLQELKMTEDKFPFEELRAAGYEAAVNGQKTYNGVAILSRLPMQDIVRDMPAFADEQKRVVAATIDGVRIVSAYVVNGQALDSDKYRYKLDWLDALHGYAQDALKTHSKFVLLGDYNIAPDDRDVHDPKVWEGQVLVSDKERAQWQRLLALGLHDAFRLFEQPERLFSWWDYRQLGFQKNLGLRIDHILLSDALKETCRACVIDKAPRKKPQPSDHTPVVADLSL
jgi:exodeoxyribonuclease III